MLIESSRVDSVHIVESTQSIEFRVIGLSVRDVSRCSISGFNIAWFRAMNFNVFFWCVCCFKIVKISLKKISPANTSYLSVENGLFPFVKRQRSIVCGCFNNKKKWKKMKINLVCDSKTRYSQSERNKKKKWTETNENSMRSHSSNWIFEIKICMRIRVTKWLWL